MKRYPLITLTLLLAMSAFAPNLHAGQWSFDKAHSIIYFDVNHIYSEVRGNFTDFDGSFNFDPKNPAAGSITITVQTQSVNTQETKRDNHLRGDEFFAVSKYPTMTFKSTAISHVKDDNYLIKGELTIKDVTRSIEVPFKFLGAKTHPFMNDHEVAGFQAQFTIDRLAYHVGNGKYFKLGVIGKNVDIFISLEMLRKK